MKGVLSILFSVGFWASVEAQLYFPPTNGGNWDTTSASSLGWCNERIDSLYTFLDSGNTKAFILLKDGKIVLEKYFDGHTASDNWYWASAGKSLTAFMVGIAQQEGFLNISDTTSTYLGQAWTDCTAAQEEKITIRNQLTMTNGLDDGVADVDCTLDSCLQYLADPNTRWAYHNGPYTLLDAVVENATGSTLNAYTTQKVKNVTGMDGAFLPLGYNNVFFSTARSMARFGLLILNQGNWDGVGVLTDTNYFREMTTTSQSINEAYGYLWWLNGKSSFMVPQSQFVFPGSMNPDAPNDMFSALGKNGQFINVVPSENLVWIRMGDSPDNSLVSFTLNNTIWQYINQLHCGVFGLKEEAKGKSLNVYPNPATNILHIETYEGEHIVGEYRVYNTVGKLLATKKVNSTKLSVDITNLPSGIYHLQVNTKGQLLLHKFIKQ